MNPHFTEFDRRRFLSLLSKGAAAMALSARASSASLPAAEIAALSGKSDGPGRSDLYRIRQLSDRELLQTYVDLLSDACSYAESEWKTASFDPAAGFWGDGVSSGNGGIRTIVSMLLACATLLKYDESLAEGQRRNLLEKSLASIRYTTATHRTGAAQCTDSKQWGATDKFGGESWQSGMWTGTFVWATWLIWDRIGPEIQHSIGQVVAWECDILSRRQPPNGLWGDTKAEENGWEVPCLVIGSLLFSSHANAAAWNRAALKYMMNTLCTQADTQDGTIVDGQPISQWVSGANLQPDFTLENHNIFHPSYVGCSSYFLTQAVMYYTFGGHPIPQAATHHLIDTWRMFQTIILPWGEAAYPQGMDWELHGTPYINLYASLATNWHDPLAAHLELYILQYLRAWQKMGNGDLALPGSRFGIVRHAINAEQAAYGYLAHKIFGTKTVALSSPAAAAQESGVHDYQYVDFIAHRTESKFASFSWKNRIMGLLIPTGAGHEGNPDFTVPIQNGFIGSFELASTVDKKSDSKVTVVDRQRRQTTDGFETSGTIIRNGGRLKQQVKFTSIGSQTVIYEDQVSAMADVTILQELGVPLGIENDAITGGVRTVTYQAGQKTLDWKSPREPLAIDGSWVNVDGRIGAVAINTSGLTYVQASSYSPGISVYSDNLYCSYSNLSHTFNAGQIVARRLIIFFVEVSPQDTARLAASYRIEKNDNIATLRFRQPDGIERIFALELGE